MRQRGRRRTPSTGDRRALIAQEHDPALKLPSRAHKRMLNGSITGECLPENLAVTRARSLGVTRQVEVTPLPHRRAALESVEDILAQRPCDAIEPDQVQWPETMI
jgi:hypothetical protein